MARRLGQWALESRPGGATVRKGLLKEPPPEASSGCLMASRAGPTEASGFSALPWDSDAQQCACFIPRPRVLGCSLGTAVVGGPRDLTQQP